AQSVKPNGTKKKTNVSETYCRPKPAARNPSGPTIPEIVMNAVITFGRSAVGVRTVSTAIIGAFTSGAQIPNEEMTTITLHHGIGTMSSQSGRDMATMAIAASLSSGTFRTTCEGGVVPTSAPPPNPPKREP